jgi:hypothetical protein
VIKGFLVTKHPSYGRWTWLAFTPSCQPHHHHVNPVIMSTTLYCKPHHYQVVGKCDSSEEAQSAVFLGGNVAPEVAEVEVGLGFRACGPRSWKVVDKTRTGL